MAVVDGSVTDIEFDENRYRSIYEVEVYTETEEYDLKFDAYTGKLLNQKKELRDDDEGDLIENNTSTTTKITKAQAMEKP